MRNLISNENQINKVFQKSKNCELLCYTYYSYCHVQIILSEKNQADHKYNKNELSKLNSEKILYRILTIFFYTYFSQQDWDYFYTYPKELYHYNNKIIFRKII